MATDLFTPRLPDQQQSAFFQAQAQQLPQHPPLPTFAPHQTYTPQISPLSTSGNASPTSPKHYVTRPMRPLFMPAVLRPTEFPPKPMTPRSQPESDEDEDERILKSNSSFISLSGLGALGRLSRRSTGDSGKCVDENWNLDMFPEATGTPTREHWKPDYESTICDHATCRRTFTYFTRRHHCRKCGNIFCDAHSALEIPLDQDANFNPRGVHSRACGHCYSQFKEWRSRTNSRHSSGASSASDNNSSSSSNNNNSADEAAAAPATPIAASPTTPVGKRMPEVALSVPRDWNWSTF